MYFVIDRKGEEQISIFKNLLDKIQYLNVTNSKRDTNSLLKQKNLILHFFVGEIKYLHINNMFGEGLITLRSHKKLYRSREALVFRRFF